MAVLEVIFEKCQAEEAELKSSYSFESGIAHFLSSIEQAKHLDVAISRMGTEGEKQPLATIGKRLGLSRERVRQIETRLKHHLAGTAVPGAIFRQKVDSVMEGKGWVALKDLAGMDPWFEGVASSPFVVEFVLRAVYGKELHLAKLGGDYCISIIGKNKWAELVTRGRVLLRNVPLSGWSKTEAEKTIHHLLTGRAQDMRELLYRDCSDIVSYVARAGDEEDIRVVWRGGVLSRAIVEVLTESPAPLHLSELARRVSERAGKDISTHSLKNLAEFSALLLGKSIYGLQHHVPMTQHQIRQLVEACEKIVLNESRKQEWHTQDLCVLLKEQGLNIPGLTKYTLSIALKESKNLIYRGKLFWANKQLQGSRRSEKAHLIEEILKAEGRPMTAVEIREKFRESRSVGKHFQIYEKGELVKVLPGVWGLRSWVDDGSVVESRESRRTGAVGSWAVEVLKESQTPLHTQELARRVTEKAGQPVTARQVYYAARRVAKRFGRGVFGLDHHDPGLKEKK